MGPSPMLKSSFQIIVCRRPNFVPEGNGECKAALGRHHEARVSHSLQNIAPAEIETVLMSQPAVDEAAVIGIPSVEWGQTVKAYVVLRPGEKADPASIQEFCRTRLASFKRPETIEFIDALPKNALGKILRKELHAQNQAQA